MENHHSSTKPRTNLSLVTLPSDNKAAFFAIAADHYSGATDSAIQTVANNSSHSCSELSNSSFDVVMEQSKNISTCSAVPRSDTGDFVESVDSCGTTVTSSCVPSENRAPVTYQLHSIGHAAGHVVYKNMESFKRPETDASQCWALIEWETTEEEPNSYTVIESSQIIEIAREDNLPAEENNKLRTRAAGLYTGKLIHVLRGRYLMPATIVIISDDRKFLETELHELRIMAANNLISKSGASAHAYRRHTMPTHVQQYGKQSQSTAKQAQQKTCPPSKPCGEAPENMYRAKRRRCDSGSSSCTMKDNESRVSSASTPTTAREEGVADNSYVATLPPVRTITARIARNDHATLQAPPMTFDQQTQTTGTSADVGTSHDSCIVRIMSYLESIMAEQKGYRMESEYNRKILLELQEKILDQHETLRNVQMQVSKLQPTNPTMVLDQQSKETSSVNFVIEEFEHKYPPESDVGTNSMIIDSYETNTNNNHIVLESRTEDQHDGHSSNQSWSTTTPSNMDNSSNMIAEAPIYIKELENHDETNDPVSTQSTSNCATEVHTLIANDWNDSMLENDPQKRNGSEVSDTTMVAIGRNNTMVPKTVLDNIKWESYKFATRKVLQAVFPRTVLATHSLSGRPCPSQINITDKPVKSALDPNIVADVVELITKKFPVDESHVRAVITTKCADENKMMSQREKAAAPSNREKKVVYRAKKLHNKENQS